MTAPFKAKNLRATLLLGLVMFGSPVLAVDWASADADFANRENDRETIGRARAKYLDILRQVTDASDKIRAVSQLARLAIYEGDGLLPKTARAERRAIFSACWCREPRVSGIPPIVSGSCSTPGFIDAISPQAIGIKVPAYYFFRGTCEAYWGEQGSLSEQLAFTSWIVDSINRGRELDPRFEGAGNGRLAAGVYSIPEARAVGLYDPVGALGLINTALGQQAYPGDPSNGANYYENWHLKVIILRQLASDSPHSNYLQQAIASAEVTLTEMDERMADDDYPVGRAPEFKVNYEGIKRHYKAMTGNEWGS